MGILLPALFGFSVGLAAFLLFWIQPLAARLLLPTLGGSPAVWNTCLVFFQAALLAGYATVHASSRSRRLLTLIPCVAIVAGLLLAPSTPPALVDVPAGAAAVPWLLVFLARFLGIPFLALAMASPLLQRWYADRLPDANPYVLYASSNVGSLLALLAYPFVLEPWLRLSQQLVYWRYGLVAWALSAVMAWSMTRVPRSASPVLPLPDPIAPRLTMACRGGWLLRAALTSSLMLAVTAHLSTDIASVPLLWVLPLALFLLAFAAAFALRSYAHADRHARLARIFILPLAVWMGAQPRSYEHVWVPLALHLLVFVTVAFALHEQIAARRPHPSQLTGFYLVLAIGGLLGSSFNTFVAPWLFNDVVEYPLGLVLACLLLADGNLTADPNPARRRVALAFDFLLPSLIGFVIIWFGDHLWFHSRDAMRAKGLLVIGVPALVILGFLNRPLRYALGVGAVLLAAAVYQDSLRDVIYRDRSIYGTYRVQREAGGEFHTFVHGSTIHGREGFTGQLRFVPLSYYHPSGPIGDVWRMMATQDSAVLGDTRARCRIPRVAVVGLGIGTMAAYAEPGRSLTFYELDPNIVKLARDTGMFSYLQDARGEITVVLGDARLSLARATDTYGLMVFDAFTSDAIPVHLLTREALALYLARLAPGGVLAFHTSNRYLRLHSALRDLAYDAGLVALTRFDDAHDDVEQYPGKLSSDWVILARRPADVQELLVNPDWHALTGPAGVAPDGSVASGLWTDDYTNIAGVFDW